MKKYKLAIVTFFDILGFKNLIETSKDEDIFEIYQILSYFHWGHQSGWNTHNAMFKFSDSLVRVIYLNENEYYHVKQVNEEIQTVATIVYGLFAKQGILIRGGMAFGEVFSKPQHNILFGPAMNRAVELESKHAKWPRIMVDNYKEKIHIDRDAEDSYSQLYPHTWNIWPYVVEEDNLYYINILRNGDYKLQRQKILEGLQKYKNEIRVYEKYKWMAEEHNIGVLECRKLASDKKEELLIPL